MTRPLTVEFIGLCASGKSTTARQLINDLQTSGIRCPNASEILQLKATVGVGYSFAGEPYRVDLPRPKRLFSLCCEALKHPRRAISLLWFAAEILPQLLCAGGAGRAVLKEALLLKFSEQAAGFEVVIWDEAVIVQVLASGLELAIGRSELLELIRRIYERLNTVFVLHSIEPRFAVARYRDQPSRFRLDRRFSNERDYYYAAEKDLGRYKAFLETLIRQDFCAGRVLVVDADDVVEKKSAAIREFINKMRLGEKE